MPARVFINPSSDRVFSERVAAVIAAGVTTPKEMADRLGADYPRVLVRARELSGEADSWYVYRDGRWTGEPTQPPFSEAGAQ